MPPRTRKVQRKAQRSVLSQISLADLARSGISEQDALDEGWHSAPSAKQVEGFEECGLPGPVLAMPYRDLHGQPRLDVMDGGAEVTYTRLRFHEQNSVGKYIQQKGTQPHIYYSEGPDWAAIAKDTGEDVLVQEGEKKSVAACLEGYAAIGIGGVDAFTYHGELIDDFKEWDWKGRHVYIVYDSDITTKERVLKAEERLAFELALLGAIIHRVRLPSGPITPDHPTGEKWGLDDFFEIIRQDDEDPGEVMDALLDETPPEVPDEVLDGPYDMFEEVEKPTADIEWIIEDKIAMGYVQRCDGASEIGKSFCWTQLGVHICLGEPFMGDEVTQAPVMAILGEDDRRTIIPRVRSILVSLGYGSFDEETGKFTLDRDKLPDGLPFKFWCVENDSLPLGAVSKMTLEVQLTPMYRKMVMFARRFDRPPFVICDTVRDTSRFNHNDADEADAALKQIYGQLQRDLGAGVVVLSHPSKTSAQNDDIQTAGAVTNKGSVRMVTELRLSEDQRLGEQGKKYLDWIVTKNWASPNKPTTHLLLADGHFSKAEPPNPLDYEKIQKAIAATMVLLKANGNRIVQNTGKGVFWNEAHIAIKTLLDLDFDSAVVLAQIKQMNTLGIITWEVTKGDRIAGFGPGPHWKWGAPAQEEELFENLGPDNKVPGLKRESKRKKKKDGKKPES